MKVLKFGGTSLGNAARMQDVARIIESEKDCIVVCSAMAGVTDCLVELSGTWKADDIKKAEIIKKQLFSHFEATCFGLMQGAAAFESSHSIIFDQFHKIDRMLSGSWSEGKEKCLLAQGEIITTLIFDHYLNHSGIAFKWLNAFDFMQKNAEAEPVVADISNKLSNLPAYTGSGRYLTQGYICLDHNGHPDNLARGGGDYSATLIGAAVNATVIEIWTDIDGLHNSDPRVVSNTSPVRELSFGEAAELAYFGAKILHPSCVWPASAQSIPINLRNTMEPLSAGTLIRKGPSNAGIRAVAAKDGISVIRIRSARMLNAYGFLKRIFEIFENFRTPIDVITTSEVAVSLTIDKTLHLEAICNALHELGDVEAETGQSIVCVVGDVLAEHQGYAVKIMDALRHLQVKMVSFGGSRNNLTLVVPMGQKAEALNCLQKALFTNEPHACQQAFNN
ncbi:MAG: aspartate kinase [Bacteroidales bacterium]|nr:aspartate kinase [Bacteroidales bacterium]